METKLAIIAIAISLLSLSVSIYVALRDRGRLKAECSIHKHEETNEYSYLQIIAVNAGRRPVILLCLMGIYTGGVKSGYKFGRDGIKLEEGELFEERFGKYDGIMIHTGQFGEKDCELIELYFEDTQGKHYIVQNSKECIKELWASKHPLGIRTHHSSQ